MAKALIINPNEIAAKQNSRQNCLDRVQGSFGRSGAFVDRKKRGKKYACRKKFRKGQDW